MVDGVLVGAGGEQDVVVASSHPLVACLCAIGSVFFADLLVMHLGLGTRPGLRFAYTLIP